jgi:hypothetical protein
VTRAHVGIPVHRPTNHCNVRPRGPGHGFNENTNGLFVGTCPQNISTPIEGAGKFVAIRECNDATGSGALASNAIFATPNTGQCS